MGAVNAAFKDLSDKGVLERLRKLSSGTVNAYGEKSETAKVLSDIASL